ncbi:hypothetical protein MHBO_005299 [Bonamia ostreae]|uniref:Uncharacterized protein n=1 Tax=Bonamia ostreae TaxID=126728 RepID=A0ABV2AJV2_9EUKA
MSCKIFNFLFFSILLFSKFSFKTIPVNSNCIPGKQNNSSNIDNRRYSKTLNCIYRESKYPFRKKWKIFHCVDSFGLIEYEGVQYLCGLSIENSLIYVTFTISFLLFVVGLPMIVCIRYPCFV